MLLLSSPELFWDCTGECAALYTISTDLIVSTHVGESLKRGELQADITTEMFTIFLDKNAVISSFNWDIATFAFFTILIAEFSNE